MALYRILERRRGAVWVCILVIYFAAFLFVASADEMNDDTEYQKKLAKMGKKAEVAAKKKRKVDAKLANRVIKAGECGDHYQVLGLINWQIPFLKVTPEKVKRAYRERAKALHPDKNSAPNASEAFRMLEDSLAILYDEEEKAIYDQQIEFKKAQRRETIRSALLSVKRKSMQVISPMLVIFNTFIRPFATPLIVIGVLII